MTPDAFHPDLCTGDQVPATHMGLSVILYPHDDWAVEWAGQFELQGPGWTPVARVSPIPNRTIIFDGCIRHRATNPSMSAAPVGDGIGTPSALLKFDAYRFAGPVADRELWQGWRFALVMQVGCAWLQDMSEMEGAEVSSEGGEL
eukprot:TRINITY_DN16587_c1_g1_i4.p1 TRINITY_DN16587_c1_g1~~TRINITY_DN16587_c1_g1_i4.p1  ORF type:complete len:145 (+),score=14.67 TRINITY_DN16587_c1_g1_i4:625-1059(+)